jgi:ubiquitin carboxyl-terminal hydrolase 4/11
MPLGGKTHQKIEEARLNPKTNETDDMVVDAPQLPTPPDDDDDDDSFLGGRARRLGVQPLSSDTWTIPQHASNTRASLPSPSPDDPPGFEESLSHELILDMNDDNDNANTDPLLLASDRFDIPDPNGLDDDDDDVDGRRYGNVSPSSSLEAEADEEEDWDVMRSFDGRDSRGVVSPGGSPSWQSVSVSGVGSESESGGDDGSPFGDANVQKGYGVGHGDDDDETDMDTVPIHEKTA